MFRPKFSNRDGISHGMALASVLAATLEPSPFLLKVSAMSTLVSICRVTVIADVLLERRLLEACFKLGARGYTSMKCHGRGRHALIEDHFSGDALIRLEFLVQPAVAQAIIGYLHSEIFSKFAATVYSETVDVADSDSF
ncbi:MAG TPA: hypothetical protein VHV55_17385 [Pirellulales bacterium]|nr:hypothetical protein [Pirellulales bacterium]